jgi:hypothetical protein
MFKFIETSASGVFFKLFYERKKKLKMYIQNTKRK